VKSAIQLRLDRTFSTNLDPAPYSVQSAQKLSNGRYRLENGIGYPKSHYFLLFSSG
jgi:hypothetical protein